MSKRIAFFWDESTLWGLMAVESFTALGFDFDIIVSEDIRRGGLAGYSLLFVPGGWAADKKERLGPEGVDAVEGFVSNGGSYLGVCGGAGLALLVEDGIGLAPVERGEGLANFSGPIELVNAGHPAWGSLPSVFPGSVWWPAHFRVTGDGAVNVLARYGKPLDGFMVADLDAADVEASGGGWKEWERLYDMALDPAGIEETPCALECRFGKGKVVLSYPHLETPGDEGANKGLETLIDYLAGPRKKGSSVTLRAPAPPEAIPEIQRLAEEFFEFGVRSHIWAKRNRWLLRWRRGIRGIEYNALLNMIGWLARCGGGGVTDELTDSAATFFGKARRTLLEERRAMSAGVLPPYRGGDPALQTMRTELFGGGRRAGGLYKELLDALDAALLPVLKSALAE